MSRVACNPGNLVIVAGAQYVTGNEKAISRMTRAIRTMYACVGDTWEKEFVIRLIITGIYISLHIKLFNIFM